MAKQKFNLQRKKVIANKLKSSDYEFNILNPVNVKINFNLAIHQSKTFMVILVNTFLCIEFDPIKKTMKFGHNIYMSAAYFLVGDSERLG